MVRKKPRRKADKTNLVRHAAGNVQDNGPAPDHGLADPVAAWSAADEAGRLELVEQLIVLMVALFGADLLTYLCRRRSWWEAEDLAQDTWYRASRDLTRRAKRCGDLPRDFRHWVFGIAKKRRATVDRKALRRRAKREVTYSSATVKFALSADPLSALIEADRVAVAWDANGQRIV
jgi:DNA-directed RNA polymerase specialized sigma24 family protein